MKSKIKKQARKKKKKKRNQSHCNWIRLEHGTFVFLQMLFSLGSLHLSNMGKENNYSCFCSQFLRRKFLSALTNTISYLLLFFLLLYLVIPFYEVSSDVSTHPWSPDAHLCRGHKNAVSPREQNKWCDLDTSHLSPSSWPKAVH